MARTGLVGPAAEVSGAGHADHPLPHLGARQEVRLQLDGREAGALGDVGAASGRAQGVGEGDHGGGEEEPGAGDELGGDVDVADDLVGTGLVEHHAVQPRREGAEEVVQLVGPAHARTLAVDSVDAHGETGGSVSLARSHTSSSLLE